MESYLSNRYKIQPVLLLIIGCDNILWQAKGQFAVSSSSSSSQQLLRFEDISLLFVFFLPALEASPP